MKIENIIRRVLREEQEEEKLLKIPSLKFFNNDWSILQKFLESQGNPRYSIGGDLDLRDSDIETLGNLVRVEGVLNLSESDIKTLGNLVRVEGGLNLMRCFNLQSLGNLEYVGGLFYLYGNENLQSLGNLVRVKSDLDLGSTRIETLGNLEYVGGDLNLHDTPIRIKYTEEQIRNMIEVVGEIYM
jgi:hypothetical protein